MGDSADRFLMKGGPERMRRAIARYIESVGESFDSLMENGNVSEVQSLVCKSWLYRGLLDEYGMLPTEIGQIEPRVVAAARGAKDDADFARQYHDPEAPVPHFGVLAQTVLSAMARRGAQEATQAYLGNAPSGPAGRGR